ncbi:hypothetical protein [Paenibacillus illinoisensis]|uniref:hypothetical protein n=1 Tax=Paenibacillus illinoisensis TaxID=59845 RepID=UPI00203EFF26|nr:hypothetical protein [Paenibacillus illinoisensis]MCM3205642.1 hypothetical protein [Paenibacillus illinoisensis]
MTNITVLKDESLGGVEREYREVKRKAAVGELVKMYDYAHGQSGEILKVRASMGGAEQFEGKRDGHGSPHYIDGRGNGGYVYLTLESTDIIRIDSARFRMVDRKATVGERVIVVSMRGPNSTNGRYYKTGDIAKVVHVNLGGSGKVVADLTENAEYYGGGTWNIDLIDYRVLEPLTSAEPAPLLSDKPAPDQAAELIAKLTTRVATLEKRVAALETPKSRPATDEEVADVIAKLSRAKYPQEIRDDIVKRAKEDVSDLRKFKGTKIPNDSVKFWPRVDNPMFYSPMHMVEYVVNRDKRTVVAIIRCTIDGHITRGIAKCAPGDVFNSHIGRAIALRRALGLEVPAEYFEAPNPTEVRVGDVVEGTSHSGAIGPVLEIGHDGEENFVIYRNDTNPSCFSRCWSGVTRVIILDDSRTSEAESDSAEPRKEVA